MVNECSIPPLKHKLFINLSKNYTKNIEREMLHEKLEIKDRLHHQQLLLLSTQCTCNV